VPVRLGEDLDRAGDVEQLDLIEDEDGDYARHRTLLIGWEACP
jgi:hypothetical protein